MTASKDVQIARPTSQHRPSTVSGPSRQSSSRPHAYSASMGSLNAPHRINRRKSSSSTAVNPATLSALKDAAIGAKASSSAIAEDGAAVDSVEYAHVKRASAALEDTSGAVFDRPAGLVIGAADKISTKARARRSSEGSRLVKGERVKSPASELKCETCGKSYKHGSCLNKHLWEHTPEWALTSKFLISKHQQVQLLEAASVLVTMNQEMAAAAQTSMALDGERSSGSPPASGSSGPTFDEEMSSRTSTPSENGDNDTGTKPTAFSAPRRQDSYSSVFSHSFGSTSGTSYAASSLPRDTGFGYRPRSMSRPTTANTQFSDDQADLTAAAESLLSCSLGTPRTGPIHDSDIPPVPPLPAKFAANRAEPHFHSYHARSESYSRSYRTNIGITDSDVPMIVDQHRFGGVDDDFEGVFGRMEQ